MSKPENLNDSEDASDIIALAGERAKASRPFALITSLAFSKEFDYAPRRRLVLAGRGAIFQSMAQTAKATGYEVYGLSPDHNDIAAARPFLDVEPVHLT